MPKKANGKCNQCSRAAFDEHGVAPSKYQFIAVHLHLYFVNVEFEGKSICFMPFSPFNITHVLYKICRIWWASNRWKDFDIQCKSRSFEDDSCWSKSKVLFCFGSWIRVIYLFVICFECSYYFSLCLLFRVKNNIIAIGKCTSMDIWTVCIILKRFFVGTDWLRANCW